jgi:anti-sigma-K factor RskA
MSTEEQQEQAALYALELLTADEAASFEQEMQADPDLDVLARELRESAHHALLGGVPAAGPSAALKGRVLAAIRAEGVAAATVGGGGGASAAKIVAFRPLGWLPWAMAAGLAVFCGLLVSDRTDLRRELAAARSADPASLVAVYSLDPADNPHAGIVSIAWVPTRQSGILQANGLANPGEGRDYQLWAVDADRKEPVSAGLVRVDGQGHARVEFKPDAAARHVSAFAISVEPTGGSAKKTGPIVFVGKD